MEWVWKDCGPVSWGKVFAGFRLVATREKTNSEGKALCIIMQNCAEFSIFRAGGVAWHRAVGRSGKRSGPVDAAPMRQGRPICSAKFSGPECACRGLIIQPLIESQVRLVI
jgi:hypothetical protein